MVDLTPQWPGSRFKKKTNHGGILDFWRHVTEHKISKWDHWGILRKSFF